MVTTKGQETDRVWGLRQGAIDYLVKPVSAQALVEKAQAALAPMTNTDGRDRYQLTLSSVIVRFELLRSSRSVAAA